MDSKLAKNFIPASPTNYTVGTEGSKKCEITIHHCAGILTSEQIGAIFQNKSREASSHYGIGKNGDVSQFVRESDTAWTNSNWESNKRAITIEVSNDEVGGDWHVSNESLAKLILLVADIAHRHNIKLVKGKTLTWHRMYSATTCPGNYLLSKIDYIIEKANSILNSKEEVKEQPKEEKPQVNTNLKHKLGETVRFDYLCYTSTSDEKLKSLVHSGKITKIIENAKNPYLINNGTGWLNDNTIIDNVVQENIPSKKSHYVGEIVHFDYLFYTSQSTEKLKALIHSGKITKIIPNAKNPYLINDGTGWLNDETIL